MTSTTQQSPISERQPFLIKRDWLPVSVMTVIMSIIWIGGSVYFTLNTSSVPEVQRQRLQPLSTQLDEKVLEALAGRQTFLNQPLEEGERVIFQQGGTQENGESETEAVSVSPTPTEEP